MSWFGVVGTGLQNLDETIIFPEEQGRHILRVSP